MAKRLSQNLNSAYIEAANRLNSKHARRKIVAYVESYDDIFFWSHVLRGLETEDYCFEVMLPSRTSLSKGKKIALANSLGDRLGKSMIACVDADYDYLLQGATDCSYQVTFNPYVFHTYVYAIENYACYAPSLRNVCVMATLNDRNIFDFENFLSRFSEIIWPLFVWSVWAYRYGFYKSFSMLDFYRTILIEELNFYHPDQTLETLRHRVNGKISRLQRQFPEGKKTYKPLRDQLLSLGVTPTTCYLYMRGHDLQDGIVVPIMNTVCEVLRREREREIRQLAEHATQQQNELAAYQHATSSVVDMLKKHTDYDTSEPYLRMVGDLQKFLEEHKATWKENTTASQQPCAGERKEEGPEKSAAH